MGIVTSLKIAGVLLVLALAAGGGFKPAWDNRTTRGALAHPERLAYYAFDILWLNDDDLRGQPLLERKFRLAMLLRDVGGPLVYVDHLSAEQGQGLYDAAIALGCEGIVSKRANARDLGGDTREWLKIKPPEVRERQAVAIRRRLRTHGAPAGAQNE